MRKCKEKNDKRNSFRKYNCFSFLSFSNYCKIYINGIYIILHTIYIILKEKEKEKKRKWKNNSFKLNFRFKFPTGSYISLIKQKVNKFIGHTFLVFSVFTLW